MPDRSITEVDDLVDEIHSLLHHPATDDPLDVLRSIAEVIGEPNYTYFDERGTWVYHPAPGDG